MKKIHWLLIICCVACASRESFEGKERHRTSYIFEKCYDVFSQKYPSSKKEALEFFVDNFGVLEKKYNSEGSTLKKKLGECFYKNAKRYKYTPSTPESKVSFRFQFKGVSK